MADLKADDIVRAQSEEFEEYSQRLKESLDHKRQECVEAIAAVRDGQAAVGHGSVADLLERSVVATVQDIVAGGNVQDAVDIDSLDVRIFFSGQGPRDCHTDFRQQGGVKIPRGKYRVLTFMVPVREDEPT